MSKYHKNRMLFICNLNHILSDQLPLSQGNLLQKNSIEGATIEVSEIDLLSNSSLNSTSLHTEEKRLADAKWLKNVRMAIEGVTQLLVGVVGLVGKNFFNVKYKFFVKTFQF